MATATAPPKPPPRPPGGQAPPAATTNGGGNRRALGIVSGLMNRPQRIGLYGTGGIGKSTLVGLMQSVELRVLVYDTESGTAEIDVDRVPVATWDELLAGLTSDMNLGYDAIAIDSATRAEEMAIEWVLRNVPRDNNGGTAKSIEDYGYGKGYVHVYEAYTRLFGVLDQHIRAGRHVVLVAHECNQVVRNPLGEDFVRYEPRLQNPGGGKNSVRHRLKEWVDHLLFLTYDVTVNRDGKGIGAGSRTIYPCEMPGFMAKSRRMSQPLVYQWGDATLWTELLGLERQA